MEEKEKLNRCFLILILILASILRFYGINWDQGHHLHPDERMITMVVERIHLPRPLTLKTLLNPESPLNPQFFAYGSLPLYLLKGMGTIFSFFDPNFAHYSGIHLVGRLLSVVFELGIIIIIYKISQTLLPCLPRGEALRGGFACPVAKLYGVALLPSLFYSLSVLAIQTAHFYVVDVPLTFFITLALYLLIKLASKPSFRRAILVGIAFGLALASKISSILLIVPVLVALTLILLRKRNVFLIFKFLFVIFTFSFLIFTLTMPYALIDFKTFWAHTLEQSRMTKNAFTFPYTLQFVGTTPYLYQLKNMVFWGMGIPLGVISIAGAIFVTLWVLKTLSSLLHCYIVTWLQKKRRPGNLVIGQFASRREFRLSETNWLILLSFFWPYFLVTGSFAIKFMRYWLPIYPLFCIFGGLLVSRIIIYFQIKISKIKNKKSKLQIKYQKFLDFTLSFCILIFAFCILLWPLSLLSIYSKPHTRVTASKWIYENIPAGSTLAVEHWDDWLPLPVDKNKHVFNFVHVELPLYEPDTEEKWHQITTKLDQTDYIIIASNRLYVPLMKLTDCQNLPEGRCYPKTAEYYQKLFDGQLDFTKVAEFTSYPKLLHCYLVTLLPCYLNDDSADESFTVYDHPKIMIFKKTDNVPRLSI